MQEMTVFLYKLDAQMYTYTMLIADQDMESASEVWERIIPKPVSQTSPFEMLLYMAQWQVSELRHGRYSSYPQIPYYSKFVKRNQQSSWFVGVLKQNTF